MSRILLTTLGSLGDLHPMIAIGLELRRRGHYVCFCVAASFRSKIENLGFEFELLRPDITSEGPAAAQVIREIMDPRRGAERLLRNYLFPELRASYEDLMGAVSRKGGADLLVSGELVYAAPLVAEKTGVPWASCILSPSSFFSAHDPPVLPVFSTLSGLLRRLGASSNRLAFGLVKLITRGWCEPIRSLRTELSLPPGRDPLFDGKHSPRLVLAMFSATLAGAQPDWPKNTVVTGFAFYDGMNSEGGAGGDLEDFLGSGEPPIVFTLGSSAVQDPGSFYEASAEAALMLGRRGVLLLGKNPPPARLPKDVACLGYVRYSELFSRAAAVVHSGGIGTTGQVLRAGCPMLVMPYGFDQPDNGARVARLGAGLTIARRRYTARRASRALQGLLTDPRHRLAAAGIGHRVRAERGTETSCDALEKLLRTDQRTQ